MSADDANDIKGLLFACVFALALLFIQGCMTKSVPQQVTIVEKDTP